MQGCGSGAEADRMFCAYPRRERFFELLHLGSGGEPIRTQRFHNRLNVVVIDRLAAVGQQRVAHWLSALHGEHFPDRRVCAHAVALCGCRIITFCDSDEPPPINS